MKKSAHGFSLIELLIVVAIIMLISAMAFPKIQKVQTRYRLDTSGHAVAGLVQQARMQAVRTNQPVYVQFDTTNATAAQVWVNSDKAAYAPGNTLVTTNGGVILQTGNPNGVALDQLKTYLGQDAGTIVVEASGTPIGFNARGLPCIGLNGIPSVCSQLDAGQIPAFLWLMSSGQGSWEAVTVTAAGKVKTWQLAQGATTWN
jgi:prepilin-type N-terminal cleavage/methylation domain-containing protein